MCSIVDDLDSNIKHDVVSVVDWMALRMRRLEPDCGMEALSKREYPLPEELHENE